ncbi:MAG: hypothetical protein K2N94_16585 [Lachnospiraceae bacterium]|nr:hypothetical protein [Lachnospiraceae bacterium]
MGISKKGKRTITYRDKKYVWWVREEDEYWDEPWLTVASTDKSLILSCRVGACNSFVSSKGRVFQGKETSGKWEYYRYPFDNQTPLTVITPGFVQKLLAWAVDGRSAELISGEKPVREFLYRLILGDDELAYENYREEFDIGVFSSREKAERIAAHYLKHVEGFKDYKCSYRIVEKKLFAGENDIGEPCDEVYMVYGWNENENGDEVEIVESECFADEFAAKQAMAVMKEKYVRSEWSFCRYRVDEWKWTDGFVRV